MKEIKGKRNWVIETISQPTCHGSCLETFSVPLRFGILDSYYKVSANVEVSLPLAAYFDIPLNGIRTELNYILV